MFIGHSQVGKSTGTFKHDPGFAKPRAGSVSGPVPARGGAGGMARTYDLADSKYSSSGEFNKCLLHSWSAESNAVRRALDAEVRHGILRLMVQRLGADAAVAGRDLSQDRASYAHCAESRSGRLSTAFARGAGAECSSIHS